MSMDREALNHRPENPGLGSHSVKMRQAERDEIEAQTAAFLANGGSIKQIESYTLSDLRRPYGREQQDQYEHVRVYVREIMTRRGNRSRPPIKNIAVNIGAPYDVVDSIWRQELAKVSSMNGNKARKKSLSQSSHHDVNHPKVKAELEGLSVYHLGECQTCGSTERYTANEKCTTCYAPTRNRRRTGVGKYS